MSIPMTFSLLALTASTAALLVSTGHTTPDGPLPPSRGPRRLCEEVRVELLIHAAEFPGSMTTSEAHRIADKCLETFAK